MLNIGNSKIGKLYLGDTALQKVYRGDELIFLGKPSYTVSLSVDPAGGGTVTGAGTYPEGAQVTVKANPEDGFEFAGWQIASNPRLPDDYTELEYIESSGTQYINTQYNPTTNTKAVLDFQLTATTSVYGLFGSRKNSSDRAQQFFAMAYTTDSLFEANYFSWTVAGVSGPPGYKNRGLLTLDKENISFNETTTPLNYSGGDNSTPYPVFICALNVDGSSSYRAPMKVYGFKLYESDVFVRNFIPCTDPTGAVGLYDLVEGKFYANAGTGTFTAGPEVGGSVTISTDAEYSFTMTEDVELTAVFEEIPQYVAGVDWWETTMPSSAAWRDVAYGNGKFVAIAYNSNKAAYSEDGVVWKATTLPSSERWEAVAYGDGKFVAVPSGGSKGAYSEDGVVWKAITLPSYVIWNDIIYENGRFVAIEGNNSQEVAYSEDGINWTRVNVLPADYWNSIIYGDGKYVAVTSPGSRAAYSADGTTWTRAALPSNSRGVIAYGSGKFVVPLVPTGKIAYSEDGQSWTELSIPFSLVNITYGNGMFVATMESSTGVAYSEDGIAWASTTSPPQNGGFISYGNNEFVIIHYNSAQAAYSSAKGPKT